MKKRIRLLLLPVLVAFAGLAQAVAIPAVENLRISGDELLWDAVADAGGYNIYYYQGGPGRDGFVVDYLSTVKEVTAFEGLQPGTYKVVPFSQDEMVFGAITDAMPIWLRGNGEVDDGSTVYSANGGGDGDEIDSGNGSGVDELVVQNLSISDDTLHWDGLAGAGGCNIYYCQGGPSRFSITFDYLSTVKNRTDFSGLQPGLYRVVPFSLNEMTFGNINEATTIWLNREW